MNYRHAFHAGNFADVHKHVLLTLLIEYLKRKEKPFRVIDTHAGRGRYALSGEEARRTGEHLDGIGRLLAAPPSVTSHSLLSAYLAAIGPEAAGEAAVYSGSPLIARRLLRRQDRLSAYEMHPADAAALAALFSGDHQVKTIELDGWLALGAHVPPKEKRGIVLVDPPFEQPDENGRIVEGLARAHRRWPQGIYAVWYPLKRPGERDRLHGMLQATRIGGIVAAEFMLRPFTEDERLVGSGLVVVNAPYVFADEAERAMELLRPVLGRGAEATSRVLSISPERS